MVNYSYYSEVRMTHSTLNMQCKSCGGTLKLDKERNVIVCPYCGAEELILESDEKKNSKQSCWSGSARINKNRKSSIKTTKTANPERFLLFSQLFAVFFLPVP